jgi:HEAT repeat protein
VRSKVVIGLLISAVALAAAWFWARPRPAGLSDVPEPPAAEQAVENGAVSPPAEQAPSSASANIPHRSPTQADLADGVPQNTTPGSVDAKQAALVAKRVNELQDLGMENDPESLEAILAELRNEDPSIREAAVEAAIQFGSRSAIPRLAEAADQATDPKEKSAIQEAIDFLKQPTLAEALAETNHPAADAPPAAGASRE